MKRIIRPAILIVAAMAGSGIVLVALMTMARSLSVYASLPADFLPADAVTVLLHKPTDQDMAFWESRIPELRKAQASESVAIAKLETQKSSGVASFTPERNQSHNVGTYGIQVSDPLLLPFIAAQTNALGKASAYRALQKSIPAHSSWVFANNHIDNALSAKRMLAALLLHSGNQWGYTQSEHSLALLAPSDEKPGFAQAPIHIPHVPNRIAVLSTANAKRALDTWNKALITEDQKTLEGLLRSLITFMGPDVSYSYDVLPLLENPSVLQVTQTGGSLTILLSGSLNDKEQLNAIIERMHDSYEKTLPTTKVTRRVLDKRFSTTDLRHDSDSIEKDYEPYEDWYILTTKRSDSVYGLFTAVSGQQFHIAKREDVLKSALSQTDTLPVPTGYEHAVRTAIGVIEPVKLLEQLGTRLPTWKSILENMGDNSVHFGSMWASGVQTWVIQNQENSLKLLDSLL